MSEPTPFPTVRARLLKVKGSTDNLTEIASVPLQRSICLQTLAIAYRKLSALHGDDPAEARRLICAEMDEIDNPMECSHE